MHRHGLNDEVIDRLLARRCIIFTGTSKDLRTCVTTPLVGPRELSSPVKKTEERRPRPLTTIMIAVVQAARISVLLLEPWHYEPPFCTSHCKAPARRVATRWLPEVGSMWECSHDQSQSDAMALDICGYCLTYSQKSSTCDPSNLVDFHLAVLELRQGSVNVRK
jgi:hypothetical protein